jgi:TRAP-type uncharacterized transport system substrate-binding protein
MAKDSRRQSGVDVSPNEPQYGLKNWVPGEPRIERSVTLQFIGDWGQANFHRICSWLCQEFCDRSGSHSRVGIWNTVHGGIDAAESVFNGEVDMAIITPAQSLPAAREGGGIMNGRAMPSLRALAVLPQRDRLVLALPRELGISTFEQLREKKPALSIATSEDNGANLIGYFARRFMEAHGIDEATLQSWGGRYIDSARPDLSVHRFRDGVADALLQEAIMTPWWTEAVKKRDAVFVPAEPLALAKLKQAYGWRGAEIAAGFFNGQPEAIQTLDFSDFVLVVREDMPDDVAHLLTWCVVEQRMTLERQFHHIPPERSPLSYPLDPVAMAQTSLPLHRGARKYYEEAGIKIGDTNQY